ncbi:toll/interleukin-1 receptor domain-containing adapter protein [Thalassophryne amazonica]|uniref:toll/interleukin-1 receptor domain-containing adapter protein n=1 Tax=Thalassophryne amazonica TaxID=390379 RepID=UPI00147235B7|nr:toll/interleukin-1 receptor domain-containing adapter protein [Thalassophryne amazonica]
MTCLCATVRLTVMLKRLSILSHSWKPRLAVFNVFFWQRDSCPGGAIPTEVCQAVQESHFKVLLITPNFLQDDWCKYMMHQALAEGPLSNQMIPLIQNLSFPEYPQEIKFLFYVDLTKNPSQGYTLVKKTVLKYLEDISKNEKHSK